MAANLGNMQMSDGKAGYMTQQWTAWCGGCMTWDMVGGTRAQSIKELRRCGWENNRQSGWLCPVCVKKAKIKPKNTNGSATH